MKHILYNNQKQRPFPPSKCNQYRNSLANRPKRFIKYVLHKVIHKSQYMIYFFFSIQYQIYTELLTKNEIKG